MAEAVQRGMAGSSDSSRSPGTPHAKGERRSQALGVGCAAAGAVCYGVTVVLGRDLARHGVGATTALGVRFAIAALVVLALGAATRRTVLPARGERLVVFLLGAVVYMGESTLFFMGLERGTAAAVALLFYGTYPAVVVLVAVAARWERLRPRTLAALLLAAAGSALVAVASGRVAISGSGMAFALGAGAVFAGYLLAGSRLVRRTDPLTTAGWVAGGAALCLLARGAAAGQLAYPAGQWPVLVGYGLATAAAFALVFAALARAGPSRTAVSMTLEAFSAVVLAAVFLGEALTWPEIVGGVAILVAAGFLALARPAGAR